MHTTHHFPKTPQRRAATFKTSSKVRRRSHQSRRLLFEALEDRRVLSVTIENLLPVVDTLRAVPDPAIRPGEITLMAEGVSDPDGEVARVVFYRGDVFLGADVDGADGWTWTGQTAGWALGEHTCYARAQDTDGGWSEAASVTVTVEKDPLAAEPFLLKDINLVPAAVGPENVVAIGNVVYFTADVPGFGWELWKSDGTEAGTVMVKDILPGSGSSSPWNLTAVGETLYFGASDGYTGWEPWVLHLNRPPVAEAGGPYVGDEGTAIKLDASGSADPDGDTLSYRWDFDNDGTWDTDWLDEPTVTHTWHDNWSGTVRVEVSDGRLSDTAVAEVTILNVAPTATIWNDGPVTYGELVTVGFSGAFDPSPVDEAAGFRYSFALDVTKLAETYSVAGESDSWSIGLVAGTHPVYGRIFDKDDGYSDYTTTVVIDKAQLTVTADDQLKVYDGSPFEYFTVSYNGFVGGEDHEVLEGELVLGGPAVGAIDAGTYVITADGLTSTNYNIAFETGTLTINKADATIAVSGTTVTYDGDAHGASGTATGVKGEALAGLDLGQSFTDVPGGTANWVFSDVTGNYNADSGSVEIVINKADQHLTWDEPVSILHGTPLSDEQLNASVWVVGPAEPGALSYDPDFETVLDVGIHTLTVTAAATDNYNEATLSVELNVLKPYSISGIVFVDFNNDGEVNFGEMGIADVLITLTGTDDLGQEVDQDVWTDVDGFYKFENLRPGDYYVTQTQPEGYLQGINSVGTLGGEESAVDQFFLELGEEVLDPDGYTDGMDYNFGERPPAEGDIEAGQTASIGFWQNRNGQRLIESLNEGAGSTQLGDWLAATFPNMFGDLADKSNTVVGQHFRTLFATRGQKLEAQVMATALAVYITNESLAGTAGQAYGFTVTEYGVGTRTYNVGTNGAAFGVENDTEMTVLDLLLATDDRTCSDTGVLHYDDDLLLMRLFRNMANEVYDDINN